MKNAITAGIRQQISNRQPGTYMGSSLELHSMQSTTKGLFPSKRWIFPKERWTIPIKKSSPWPLPSDFFRDYNGK
jgi:hypothetical protein